jgi:hypothetical protein
MVIVHDKKFDEIMEKTDTPPFPLEKFWGATAYY